jgi:hypothetical protein
VEKQQPHGRGKTERQSGSIYEGNYINGLKEGSGIYKFANDDTTSRHKATKMIVNIFFVLCSMQLELISMRATLIACATASRHICFVFDTEVTLPTC